MSFLAAVLALFLLYLLVALAPPIGPWTNRDEISNWLFWALHGLVVALSLGLGALSSADLAGLEGSARPRPRVVGSERVALLLTPGWWTVVFLMAPILANSEMPEWQRRFMAGEGVLALPLAMLPESACAVFAGQTWRRTRRWWSAAGAIVGGPLGYLAFWTALKVHSDLVGVLVWLWVWPAATLFVALRASRRADLEA
jgi:hypothetical protein